MEEITSDNIDQMREKFKPKKKANIIPEELMSKSASYDDKLLLAKLLSEKESKRVILVIKQMLKADSSKSGIK
jgi:hypothetical protein